MNNTYRNQGIIITIFFVLILLLTVKLIDILTPFILGFVFAYILDPCTRYLSEKRNLNKKISILIILSLFFLAFFTILYYLIPGIILQASELIIKLNIKSYLSKGVAFSIFGYLSSKYPFLANLIENSIGAIYSFFFKFSNHLFANIIQSGKIALNFATILLLTPILTFYFALDMNKIISTLKKLIPISYKEDVIALFKDINITIAKYVRGQFSVCIILAIYYTTCLSFLNIDYSLVLGLFSGLSLFIPYFGILFSFILTAVISYLQFKTVMIVLYVIGVYVLGQIMEGVFITPRLIGRSLNLHPLWIFLGIFVGGSFLGFFGVLFAIPLTAIIAVIIKFVINIYKKSKIYKH